MAAPGIEWRQTALTDLFAIVDYIADDNPDAAQRIKDEIQDKVSKLPEYPKLYKAGRISGTREMVVQPNYVVVYTEDTHAIAILRVLHGAQQWPPIS